MQEGYTKYSLKHINKELPEAIDASGLLGLRDRLYDYGWIGLHEELGVGFGNVSERIGSTDRFLISGTQTGQYYPLRREHIALVTKANPKKNKLTCEGLIAASSEGLTHAAVYAALSDVRYVIHIHEAAAWQRLLGQAPTTDAAVPYGTPQMAAEVQRLIAMMGHPVTGFLVMGGHEDGLLAWGDTLLSAEAALLHGMRPQ
ncbi:MAG: class II aldolase/adducin family protein [Bacteroidia bacterium]|nr:class II aldolase/adducin family protein [Bacteroidia bacterium]